ncbi:MAG: nuclear transport factor 2 family protein [Pyrinomonadaceae bacterium]
MKYCFAAIVVALLLGMSCSTAPKTGDPEQVKSELAAVERRLIAAVQRKDMATLNEIWDDQYYGTAPNGRTVTKSDLMKAVQDGVIVIDSIEPEDLYVRLFGDVAVMTGKASVKAKVVEDEISTNVRGTGIFVRRDGKWKIAGVHVGPDRPDGSIDPEVGK